MLANSLPLSALYSSFQSALDESLPFGKAGQDIQARILTWWWSARLSSHYTTLSATRSAVSPQAFFESIGERWVNGQGSVPIPVTVTVILFSSEF
jgi:hypothetical protein